ncbi:3'-5' exonuclease [Belliella sp. DSM 111904]|uniref:3'-5' exonuclease n=1 Tax=Belliella filtrata TaxID=2923435 RepID=A0ABS9UX69_9BACT|nr:3'-5' exonuclease [Belliella filtrata]MCH7408709.1 3'-5' exonuclease [Belliella filtrata]
MKHFFEELNDILFLDIETASIEPGYELLSERYQEEWLKKERHLHGVKEELVPGSLFFEKAGIYAEFGKVICIGVGFFHFDKETETLTYRSKTFAEPSEYHTLKAFKELLDKKPWTLCAHNGKEFDFPYLARRILINRIPLPEPLQLAGKKPWEVRHLDTLEFWKFGDYKHYTRLELLATVFDIPTSKDGIDGSKVNESYYKHNDLQTIRTYCSKDVLVTARIFLAFRGIPPELDFEIVNLDEEQA